MKPSDKALKQLALTDVVATHPRFRRRVVVGFGLNSRATIHQNIIAREQWLRATTPLFDDENRRAVFYRVSPTGLFFEFVGGELLPPSFWQRLQELPNYQPAFLPEDYTSLDFKPISFR